VALVTQGQERWLVAAFGDVNWVRNLRAAGTADLIRGRHAERIGVEEPGPSAAAPILQQFLNAYRWVMPRSMSSVLTLCKPLLTKLATCVSKAHGRKVSVSNRSS
jgi:hypothetical protein